MYEVEVVLNGKEFDILVSAAGKYLGTEGQEEASATKTQEDDEDERDEENDDDG